MGVTNSKINAVDKSKEWNDLFAHEEKQINHKYLTINGSEPYEQRKVYEYSPNATKIRYLKSRFKYFSHDNVGVH